VDEQRQKNSQHDAELKQRTEPSAFCRRRKFRDIHRTNHRGRADAQTADEARCEKFRERPWNGRKQTAGGIENRAKKENFPPAKTVAQKPRAHRAGNAAENRAGAGDAFLHCVELKMRLEILVGAVDHGGVVAEKNPPVAATSVTRTKELPILFGGFIAFKLGRKL
jgi:hypothetical protein